MIWVYISVKLNAGLMEWVDMKDLLFLDNQHIKQIIKDWVVLLEMVI